MNMSATRVSINLINKGLPQHLDMVFSNQPDPYKCDPDISVPVHLSAPSDSIFLGFRDQSRLHKIDLGMMVMFHTARPNVTQPAPRRYSIVLFF